MLKMPSGPNTKPTMGISLPFFSARMRASSMCSLMRGVSRGLRTWIFS